MNDKTAMGHEQIVVDENCACVWFEKFVNSNDNIPEMLSYDEAHRCSFLFGVLRLLQPSSGS